MHKLDQVAKSKSREINKIIDAPRDEEMIIHELPDSLILVEKDILHYEAEKQRGLVQDELEEIDEIYGIRKSEDRADEKWYQNSDPVDDDGETTEVEAIETMFNSKIKNT